MTLKHDSSTHTYQVFLERNEYIRGARAGFVHCSNNICAGRQDRRGFNSFDSHIFGSVAEYAFALAMGAEWLGEREGHFNRADVAPNWQVRWSSRPEYGLQQKSTDNANWNLVLCSGRSNVITVHGWLPIERESEKHKPKNLKHSINSLYGFDDLSNFLVPIPQVLKCETHSNAWVFRHKTRCAVKVGHKQLHQRWLQGLSKNKALEEEAQRSPWISRCYVCDMWQWNTVASSPQTRRV